MGGVCRQWWRGEKMGGFVSWTIFFRIWLSEIVVEDNEARSLHIICFLAVKVNLDIY